MNTVMRKIFIAWVFVAMVCFATAILAKSSNEGSGGSNGGNDIELVFNTGLSTLRTIVEKVDPGVVVGSPHYSHSDALRFYRDHYGDIQGELRNVRLAFVAYDLFDVNGKLVSLKTEWKPAAPIVVSKTRNVISTSEDAAAALLHEISRHCGWRKDSAEESVGAAVLGVFKSITGGDGKRRPPLFSPGIAKEVSAYLLPSVEKLEVLLNAQRKVAISAVNGTLSDAERKGLDQQFQIWKAEFDYALSGGRILAFSPFAGDFNGGWVIERLGGMGLRYELELPSIEPHQLGVPYRIDLVMRGDLSDSFALRRGDFLLNGFEVGDSQDDGVSSAKGGHSALAIATAINSIAVHTGIEANPQVNVLTMRAVSLWSSEAKRVSFVLNGFTITASVNSIYDMARIINEHENATAVTAYPDNQDYRRLMLKASDGRNIVLKLEDKSLNEILESPFPVGVNIVVIGPVELNSGRQMRLEAGVKALDQIFSNPSTQGTPDGSGYADLDIATQDHAQTALRVLDNAREAVRQTSFVLRTMAVFPDAARWNVRFYRQSGFGVSDLWVSVGDAAKFAMEAGKEIEELLGIDDRLSTLAKECEDPNMSVDNHGYKNDEAQALLAEFGRRVEETWAFGVNILKGELNGASVVKHTPAGLWVSHKIDVLNLDPHVIPNWPDGSLDNIDISTQSGAELAHMIAGMSLNFISRAQAEVQNIQKFVNTRQE